MFYHNIIYIIAGVLISGIVILSILCQPFVRTRRKILNTIFPSTMPSWKIVMNVYHPHLSRPRYLSLHTIATIIGCNDLLRLAKEMKRSGEVNISFCGTVKSPVFYLRRLREENEPKIWNKIESFIKKWPFPTYRGFRGVEGHWTGETYGSGRYVEPPTAMKEPFIRQDYSYANKIITALKNAKRRPGIPEYDI